jgi:hypothetical protein
VILPPAIRFQESKVPLHALTEQMEPTPPHQGAGNRVRCSLQRCRKQGAGWFGYGPSVRWVVRMEE